VIRRAVAIGGPPGSGKSTAARRVAPALGLELIAIGDRFRAEARARGLSLEEFGHYAEAHPEIDRALDEEAQRLARPGRLFDSRIQGALCRRRGVPVYAIQVLADEEVRLRRVAERDGLPLEEARRRVRDREASERRRYLGFYGIDLDREPADLTVDSTARSPEEVAREILGFLERAEAAA
jgi:CMP/dCMP kinase